MNKVQKLICAKKKAYFESKLNKNIALHKNAPYFPAFRLNTETYGVSTEYAGKYGPE